jgi:hypothetical protein
MSLAPAPQFVLNGISTYGRSERLYATSVAPAPYLVKVCNRMDPIFQFLFHSIDNLLSCSEHLSHILVCWRFFGGGNVEVQWLWRYAASRKVVGSKPDEVNQFFNLLNSSSRTRPWGSLSI